MTNKEYAALHEKKVNCLRAIEVAAKGLQEAARGARGRAGQNAAMKKVADRMARLNELHAKLALINTQLEAA